MSNDAERRYETLLLHRDEATVTVTLNRPDRMNAWSTDMSRELMEVLTALSDDAGVRAVMLTGAGRAFCSGADLRGTTTADRIRAGQAMVAHSALRTWHNPIITLIREMPKPVISAVNGPAAGAGLSLALAADLVVAKESAYFLLAFVNVGLVPDAGSSLLVPARVGFARAAELALLGERLPAARAADIGLINACWSEDEFDQNARSLLARLGRGPSVSYAGIKQELNTSLYAGLAAQLELEATLQDRCAASADASEGVTAFREKRPARFTGA